MEYITEETFGTYGSQDIEATVLVVRELHSGLSWYCVQGSCNVNATYDDLEIGGSVVVLEDVDAFTWSTGINNVDELLNAVEA